MPRDRGHRLTDSRSHSIGEESVKSGAGTGEKKTNRNRTVDFIDRQVAGPFGNTKKEAGGKEGVPRGGRQAVKADRSKVTATEDKRVLRKKTRFLKGPTWSPVERQGHVQLSGLTGGPRSK